MSRNISLIIIPTHALSFYTVPSALPHFLHGPLQAMPPRQTYCPSDFPHVSKDIDRPWGRTIPQLSRKMTTPPVWTVCYLSRKTALSAQNWMISKESRTKQHPSWSLSRTIRARNIKLMPTYICGTGIWGSSWMKVWSAGYMRSGEWSW